MRIYTLFWEFCIRKLARILYDCVECSHTDRAELDWLTAEKFIKENRWRLAPILSEFLAATKLSENSFVSDVPSSIDISYGGLDRVYGRMVWDELYQPLRLALRTKMEMPRHTRIRFG